MEKSLKNGVGPSNLLVSKVSNICVDLVDKVNVGLDDQVDQQPHVPDERKA